MFTEQLADHPLELLPEQHRDAARRALLASVDGAARITVEPVSGGASGALVHRVGVEGAGTLLLRIETARDVFRDPHRSYVCMRTAADAGVAPAVHVADPVAGVVIMDFIEQRPLEQHPGGPLGVLRELGELTARLQATDVFPQLAPDFASLLRQMLGMIDAAGVFAPGVLPPVHDGLEQICAAYPWGQDPPVSSHNDINPYNLLFDGERLWLVDWETAFRNDRFADIACVANNFADPIATADAADALVEELLGAWLGHAPDRVDRSRLALMRQLNRVFYGCLMMSTSIGHFPSEESLDALTVDEFRTEIESGRIGLDSPRLLHVMGKMQLAGFHAGILDHRFEETLDEVRSG